MSTSPRVVLVETSEALPGLLPFQSWDALAAADVVYARDPERHPAHQHLYFAGVDVERLEPARLAAAEMDLTQPGSPEDRRLAKALLERAAEAGTATFLLGPEDERFVPIVSVASPRYDAEVEIVFFAQQPRGAELLRMVEVMARLRDPDNGCPWDLEQDHRSLLHYLIEEAYEFIEAVEGEWDPHIEEELGDLLLQVLFHAQVASDRGAFTIDDVSKGIADKLIRRHPHVFADGDAATPEEVQANWDELKKQEKPEREGPFDGIPTALPAALLAEKFQRRAAKLGFDWPDTDGPMAKVAEELAEVAAAGADEVRDEIGDLLFAAVGVARKHGVDAEEALRHATTAFRGRLERVLAGIERDGQEPGQLALDEWIDRWNAAK